MTLGVALRVDARFRVRRRRRLARVGFIALARDAAPHGRSAYQDLGALLAHQPGVDASARTHFMLHRRSAPSTPPPSACRARSAPPSRIRRFTRWQISIRPTSPARSARSRSATRRRRCNFPRSTARTSTTRWSAAPREPLPPLPPVLAIEPAPPAEAEAALRMEDAAGAASIPTRNTNSPRCPTRRKRSWASRRRAGQAGRGQTQGRRTCFFGARSAGPRAGSAQALRAGRGAGAEIAPTATPT